MYRKNKNPETQTTQKKTKKAPILFCWIMSSIKIEILFGEVNQSYKTNKWLNGNGKRIKMK